MAKNNLEKCAAVLARVENRWKINRPHRGRNCVFPESYADRTRFYFPHGKKNFARPAKSSPTAHPPEPHAASAVGRLDSSEAMIPMSQNISATDCGFRIADCPLFSIARGSQANTAKWKRPHGRLFPVPGSWAVPGSSYLLWLKAACGFLRCVQVVRKNEGKYFPVRFSTEPCFYEVSTTALSTAVRLFFHPKNRETPAASESGIFY